MTRCHANQRMKNKSPPRIGNAYRAADAGAVAGAASVERLGDTTSGGACGGTGKNRGPFCPQPDRVAATATMPVKPCLTTTWARRPRIRCEKTMTGL